MVKHTGFVNSGAKVVRQTAKTCQYVKKNALFLRKSAFFCLVNGALRLQLRSKGMQCPNSIRENKHRKESVIGNKATFLGKEATFLGKQS